MNDKTLNLLNIMFASLLIIEKIHKKNNLMIDVMVFFFQTYSSLPYGNMAYHLSLTLSSIASPVVCVLALFVTLPKKSGIVIQGSIGTIIAAFLLATAILCPTPPLVGEIGGEILIVSVLFVYYSFKTKI